MRYFKAYLMALKEISMVSGAVFLAITLCGGGNGLAIYAAHLIVVSAIVGPINVALEKK